MTRETKPTFADLSEVEPKLRELYEHVIAIQDDSAAPYFCANEIWHGWRTWHGRGLLDEMTKLVGWSARNPKLRTAQAYDISYRALYDLLPPCRDCACLAVDTFMSAVVMERNRRLHNATT